VLERDVALVLELTFSGGVVATEQLEQCYIRIIRVLPKLSL